MPTHTPGPWLANPVPMRNPEYFCIHTDTAPNIEHVAVVGGRGAVKGNQMRANAQLIASAPDMLAALRAIASVDPSTEPTCYADAMKLVRATITKAEGR